MSIDPVVLQLTAAATKFEVPGPEFHATFAKFIAEKARLLLQMNPKSDALPCAMMALSVMQAADVYAMRFKTLKHIPEEQRTQLYIVLNNMPPVYAITRDRIVKALFNTPHEK